VYFRYLLVKFVKDFVLVLLAVSVFYTVVDFMFNLKKIPSSSNLQVLYIFYVWMYALFVLYPLAFIFSFLLTLNNMIKFNELVSFYSLGFTPRKLIKPPLIFAVFFTGVMFLLNTTKLAYSSEYANALKSQSSLKTKNIFLKHNDYIIYIKELNPFLKTAKDINVFKINLSKISKVYMAKKAEFKDNRWCMKAQILDLKYKKWNKSERSVCILENFKPKILSNLKNLNSISFYDAYLVIKYFNDIDKNRILAIVFYKIFTPLAMIAALVYLFFTSPVHIRVSNVRAFMLKGIALGVGIWGSELLIFKFAKQGVVPYYSLALPFVVILLLTLRSKNV